MKRFSLKKLIIISMTFCISVVLTYQTQKKKELREKALTEFIGRNYDALTDGEYYRVSMRTKNKCTIYVGTNGRIKLVGGAILKADANGNITIDGEIVCSGNGTVLCRPVECQDLYETIF